MLRIVTEQHGERYTMTLHGKVAGEWVQVLDRCWRSLLESVPAACVTTILSDVSFVDAQGEQLLKRMWKTGVRLVASGCMNRHMVERIQGRPIVPRSGPEPEEGPTRRGGKR
jgi:hypothetical protein